MTRPRRTACRRFLVAALAVSVLAGIQTAGAQDRRARLQAEFDQQADPVRKARTLARLGGMELDAARDRLRDGQEQEALDILIAYQMRVQETVAALLDAVPDPERRPNGFKELQIDLRRVLRRFDDLILAVPNDLRPWFRAVRSDLEASEGELIDALFPRRGGPPAENTD